jgi:hypothetical protein
VTVFWDAKARQEPRDAIGTVQKTARAQVHDADGVKPGAARELARVLDVRPEWRAFGIAVPRKENT